MARDSGDQVCECGHKRHRHSMNMRTFRCDGPCLAWHYFDGPHGENACRCPHFRAAPRAY